MRMRTKRCMTDALESMKEFERKYYPNNLSHKELVSTDEDQNLSKKFTEETFARIKKKYNLT